LCLKVSPSSPWTFIDLQVVTPQNFVLQQVNGHHHGDHFSGGHVIIFIGLQHCIRHQGHDHHSGCHVLQLIVGN
jgi:hypothetical protein